MRISRARETVGELVNTGCEFVIFYLLIDCLRVVALALIGGCNKITVFGLLLLINGKIPPFIS